MRAVERFLVRIDDQPWGAVWRILLGLAIPPAFSTLAGGSDSAWSYLALFAALLAALRLAPALLRFALPISPDAKEIWRKRRFIAKEYDSYQWQKLFWIGLGMLPHAVVGGGLGRGGLTIAAFCLVGGLAGLLVWHRAGDGRISRGA